LNGISFPLKFNYLKIKYFAMKVKCFIQASGKRDMLCSVAVVFFSKFYVFVYCLINSFIISGIREKCLKEAM